MNKKFIVFYTIFASLVFVFSLAFLSYNLYIEYTYGNELSNTCFSTVTKNVKTAASQDETYFYNNIKKAIGNLDDFSFIEVKRNNKTVFVNPKGFTQEQTSSRLSKKFNIEMQTNIGRIKISTNIYKLKPATILYYSKISFLIILFITLFTIVLIIIQNAKDKKIIVSEEDDEIIEINNNEDEISISENIENTEVSIQESVSDSPAESTNVDNENESEVEEIEPVKETKKVKLPYEDYKPVDIKDEDAAPQGLFNPDTGLGWESYLNTRLESEINRAISSEFDLALFVIRVPEIDRASELCSNICSYLALQFQFKDLLFEYKKDCFVGMKISMNLDEALVFSEKLYADIKNLIGNKKCFIGISTRSIRMVSGDRLLLEADQALQHAQEDETSPVIAFRVDSEKYRQFLEHDND